MSTRHSVHRCAIHEHVSCCRVNWDCHEKTEKSISYFFSVFSWEWERIWYEGKIIACRELEWFGSWRVKFVVVSTASSTLDIFNILQFNVVYVTSTASFITFTFNFQFKFKCSMEFNFIDANSVLKITFSYFLLLVSIYRGRSFTSTKSVFILYHKNLFSSVVVMTCVRITFQY